MSELKLGETSRTHSVLPRDSMYKDVVSNEEVKLYEDELIYVAINKYPHHEGNVLIFPKRIVSDMTELTADESKAILDMCEKSALLLEKIYNVPCMTSKYFGSHTSQDPLHFHVYPVEKKYRDLYYEANDLRVWEVTQMQMKVLQDLFKDFSI